MIGPGNKSVLVVDDEPAMRMALKANFQRDGWSVETAGGATEALRKFGAGSFSLVVSDVRMPDGDGLQVLRGVRASSPSTAVIILTAFGTVPEAVRAIHDGACDYLIKPASFEQVLQVAGKIMQPDNQQRRMPQAPDEIVGGAPSLLRALDRAQHAARAEADVLIEAESGTGKELLARYIHAASPRKDKQLVAVNCAAVPEHLLESELFGHVRGAFTGATLAKPGKFELASGGTLLLDEIGEMPLNLQPKLLRALQEREVERLGDTKTLKVDIRVIATTNVSLQSMVGEGRFRADLYYRLNVIPLTIPALRDRKEDLRMLAQHFAIKFAAQAGASAPPLHPDFLFGLQKHSWPGNVREFANFMRRVLALSDGREIGPEYLEPEFLAPSPRKTTSVSMSTPVAGTQMRQLERKLLETTLEATGGNRTRAAEMLGVSLRTIRNKIREYGLPPRRFA